MTTSTYSVSGMTCEHCVGAVLAEISRLPGVRDVSVELDSGRVSVHSDAPLDATSVAAAVDEAGYELLDPAAS